MGSLSPVHWLIVVGVVVLLFGAGKLPQLARSVGQSARIMKAETRGLHDDAKAVESAEEATGDTSPERTRRDETR